ncbi:MAG: ATP-binding protein, partial [Candidatus Methanofastidiosia archaeon]
GAMKAEELQGLIDRLVYPPNHCYNFLTMRGTNKASSDRFAYLLPHIGPVVKDKVVGVLNVHSHEERGIYTKEDLEILSAIANQAAIAIENARLFKKEREAALQLEFLNDLMSHDINNINQIAMGYLELLKTPKLSEKQNIFVERALSSVKNSARLIENVRKLQKLRGEKIELEKMDMKDILKEAILEVSQHPEKNIELKFSPKENMWINGSPFLKDVFFNLLDNSIKYTPSKNVKIEVNVEDLGNSAKICVKDWGVGIPDEMKSKIFDRFERLENGVRGSGLGLYISKMIVKKLNGRIWVEDNPEGGSVFCIEFPRVVS